MPFFSFDFYTFEYRSGTASGDSPVFNTRRAYELDESKELLDYLRDQFLKIDFIDESVDLCATPEANDYIGSVRIPLRDLLTSDRITNNFPIMNEKSMNMGEVEIAIRFYNASVRPEPLSKEFAAEMLNSQVINKQVLTAIAEKLAD